MVMAGRTVSLQLHGYRQQNKRKSTGARQLGMLNILAINTSIMFPKGFSAKRARVRAAAGISLAAMLLATSAIALAGLSSMPSASASLAGAEGRIAFVSDRDGSREIYVMNPDGSGQTRLTTDPAADTSPSWSPDGARIAFTSDRDGNNEIYVVNSDGSGQTRLTNNPAADGWPSWSPDGSKIIFTSDRDGNSEIYVMDSDGTGVAPLPIGSFSNTMLGWSPDGAMMAFSGAPTSYTPPSSEDAEIYAINIDGTGLDALTDNEEADDTDPDWGAPPATRQLTVNSLSLAGRSLSMWATVRAPDGALLKSGFTPLTFAGSHGAEYKVSVANYFGKWFDHWEDNESTDGSRIIALTSDTTLTALYRTGKLGFTPIDISGRGPIIVNAVSLEDGRTLHMWTIAFATRFEAYSVKVHDYKGLVFDHWENGSTERIRSVVDAPQQTITAYYRTG